MAGRVAAPSLSLDEQIGVVARLREALSTEDRAAVRELLAVMRERRDLYHAVARTLDEAMTASPPPPPPAPAARPAATVAGWAVRPVTETTHQIIVEVVGHRPHRLEIFCDGWGTFSIDGERVSWHIGGWALVKTSHFRLEDGGREHAVVLRFRQKFAGGGIGFAEISVAGIIAYTWRG